MSAVETACHTAIYEEKVSEEEEEEREREREKLRQLQTN